MKKIEMTRTELFLRMIVAGMAGAFFSGCLLAWTYTYDNATPPDAGQTPRLGAQRIRELKDALQERLNICGYYPYTGTEISDACAGEIRRILFHEPIADTPTVAANHFDIRIKDVGGKAELVTTDEDENELQLTSKGNNVANNTNLTATDNAGTGTVNLIKADANDVAVVPDDSQTATNGAPTQSKALTNKKYVDDSIKGDDPTANDSDTETMVKAHAYLTQTAGYVSAFTGTSNEDVLRGYVGTTNDPAGAGTNVDSSRAADPSGNPNVGFFVGNGKYFEITHTSQTVTINWTPLVSGGAAPVDQD